MSHNRQLSCPESLPPSSIQMQISFAPLLRSATLTATAVFPALLAHRTLCILADQSSCKRAGPAVSCHQAFGCSSGGMFMDRRGCTCLHEEAQSLKSGALHLTKTEPKYAFYHSSLAGKSPAGYCSHKFLTASNFKGQVSMCVGEGRA